MVTVRKHSKGMISGDVESAELDVDLVKETKLYEDLKSLVGEDKVVQAIRDVAEE